MYVLLCCLFWFCLFSPWKMVCGVDPKNALFEGWWSTQYPKRLDSHLFQHLTGLRPSVLPQCYTLQHFGWYPLLFSVGSRLYVKAHLTRSGLNLRHIKRLRLSLVLAHHRIGCCNRFDAAFKQNLPQHMAKAGFTPSRESKEPKDGWNFIQHDSLFNQQNKYGQHNRWCSPLWLRPAPGTPRSTKEQPTAQLRCGRCRFPRGPHDALEDAPDRLRFQGKERSQFLDKATITESCEVQRFSPTTGIFYPGGKKSYTL